VATASGQLLIYPERTHQQLQKVCFLLLLAFSLSVVPTKNVVAKAKHFPIQSLPFPVQIETLAPH